MLHNILTIVYIICLIAGFVLMIINKKKGN